MATRGRFDRRSNGQKSRMVFVPEGTELEIGEESISSEWTTESEGEKTSNFSNGPPRDQPKGAETVKEKQKRVQLWRLRHRVRPIDQSSDSDKSKSSYKSSSTSSSSESSSSDDDVASFKRQRKEALDNWKTKGLQPIDPLRQTAHVSNGNGGYAAAAPIEQVPLLGFKPATEGGAAGLPLEAFIPTFRWFDSEKRYRAFAMAASFLSEQDIEMIHKAAKHCSVKEINDRKGYLAFKHRVWRFELQLRSLYPELYSRLMALMRHADESRWRRMSAKSKKVYPEIEYIEYDVAEMGEPCFIEPHVDNKSAVTMVAMLSQPSAYVGGRSCFRRSQGKRGYREMELQKGDVVLFRGEKLLHWITPVTAGKRIILQIELSRV
eukprot:TRINITY_DN9194_c0_g1_i1.p1 TRINITY_DN9194_c0_g1~~TRINITY_DN9194_c0_g1_i1.p1  ORF type:complete len:378 (-),score=56.42 TRINITY_DN9194_c0_g1_i1:46-1179(-)